MASTDISAFGAYDRTAQPVVARGAARTGVARRDTSVRAAAELRGYGDGFRRPGWTLKDVLALGGLHYLKGYRQGRRHRRAFDQPGF